MNEFNVNIYPIKNGEFLTSFTHPLTKKKVREHFPSRVDAQNYKRETEDRFMRPKVSNYQELNLGDLLNLYNLEKPRNSFVKYSRAHLIDFVDTFGEFKLDEVTTDALKVWLDQVQKENNLKSITMRGMKCDIDGFFKYLIEKEVISESPLTTIYYKKSNPPLKARNILSEAEIGQLLKAIKAHSPGYLYPLVKMFAETGAKTAEVSELTWRDINLSEGEVHFVQTSASRERTLKISDELVEMLCKKKSKQGYVFLTYYGEPFTKNKVRRAIDEYKAKGAFVKNWCPMDLRHSLAVNFLSSGKSLKDLQNILGHENVFTTKQLYGEASIKNISRNFKNPLDQESAITYP